MLFTEIINEILEDFSKFLFITLPYKTGTNICDFHRRISLIFHVTKPMKKILMNSPDRRIIAEIGQEAIERFRNA